MNDEDHVVIFVELEWGKTEFEVVYCDTAFFSCHLGVHYQSTWIFGIYKAT